jgi:NDP-sugar pyrophosphorylase family protein
MGTLKTAFILCGGKGTRFQEVSATKPKILATVNGRPFIEILITQALLAGYERLIFLLGHLSEPIVEFLRASELRKIIVLEYLVESEPLGTGGAVRNALIHYPEINRIFIVNGDTYWASGLPIYANQNEDCISLFQPAYQSDYGGIKVINGRATYFHKNWELGDYISAGMLCTTRGLLLDALTLSGNLENDFLPNWVNKYLPTCTIANETTDFGVVERYRKLNQDGAI